MQKDHALETTNSYEEFFGFREAPFSLAPDTRFRFESAPHQAALNQVTYALTRREPVIVVIGEIGSGKTLLCRTVIERMGQKTFLSIIGDPQIGLDELLTRMLQDFGVISKDRTKVAPASRHDLVHALQEFVLSLRSLGARAVVIIDEAQHAQPDVLEQVRLASNVHDDRGAMLQIVLVGQMDLEPLLARPELRSLRQRVSRYIRLEPLGAVEVAQYVGHRLGVARGSQAADTFAPEAVDAVARRSGGIPRLVNLLCDRALEAAYASRSPRVEISAIDSATTALQLPNPSSGPAKATGKLPRPFLSVPVPARVRRSAILGAAAALAAAVLWTSVGAMNRSRNGDAPARAAVTVPAVVREHPAPAATRPPDTRPAPSIRPETLDASATAGQPRAALADPQAEAFEIVVASFRTMERAAEVADAVGAFEPVRRRLAGGWQQVLAGPFESRADAEQAQTRLDRAGFTGTQIVRTSR